MNKTIIFSVLLAGFFFPADVQPWSVQGIRRKLPCGIFPAENIESQPS